MLPVPEHIEGSTSKEDELVMDVVLQDFEQLLAATHVPEGRQENRRALQAFVRQHGYPTDRYVAWAICGRAGTIDRAATYDNIRGEYTLGEYAVREHPSMGDAVLYVSTQPLGRT